MTKNVSGLFDNFKFWGFKVPTASLTRQHGGRAHLQKLQSRLKGVVDSGNLLLLWLRRESTTLCCSNCKSQSGQCSRPADWRPPTIGQLRQQHTFFSAPGFSAKWQLQLRQLPAAAHDAALLQVQLHFFGQHPTDAAEMFRYFRSIRATISLSDDFIPGKTKQMTTTTTTTMTTTADVHARNMEPLFEIVASLLCGCLINHQSKKYTCWDS